MEDGFTGGGAFNIEGGGAEVGEGGGIGRQGAAAACRRIDIYFAVVPDEGEVAGFIGRAAGRGDIVARKTCMPNFNVICLCPEGIAMRPGRIGQDRGISYGWLWTVMSG